MVKKIAFASAGLLLLASPLLASAQTAGSRQAQIDALLEMVAQLQQQIANLIGNTSAETSVAAESGSQCIAITHNMGPGDTDATTGGDVTRLQQFFRFQYNNFPDATGFFGPITEASVRQWQSGHGIVYSGTPNTT